MTRKPHDSFAKQYLKELLQPLGATETSRDVFGEMQQVDVWFTPGSANQETLAALGLLGQMVAHPCLLELDSSPDGFRVGIARLRRGTSC